MSQKKYPIKVTVNGRTVEREVPARMLLSDFIRQELQLTGTHVGCEHGVCGACTVILDGRTTRSCLTFAVQVDGAEISTVESLGTVNNLHPLQAAFWEKHGLQCGFCTPGMLLTAKELLARNPDPTRSARESTGISAVARATRPSSIPSWRRPKLCVTLRRCKHEYQIHP